MIDLTVRRQRRVVWSTFSAELNGLVDSIAQLLLSQISLHQIYCGRQQTPEGVIDVLEHGGLYPSLDLVVDARAVYDAVAAADTCEPQESSIKLHVISVRDRFTQGIIRRVRWADTRDMLAYGLAEGGIDRTSLHRVSNGCAFKLAHEAVSHVKTSGGAAGSSTKSPADAEDQ